MHIDVTGVGCQFVKDLFTDADTFAEQRSESMTFIAAFDDEVRH